jgi:DNA repair protein RAD16
LEALTKEETLWKTSLAEWNHEMEMNNVPKKLLPKKMGGARAGTLVVCPVIALSQWKAEIEKFTEADTLTVGIYHGPNRAKEMPPETMQKYDIVLTTYQVMEQDFRKMVSPNKVSCPNCGAKFKVDKLPVHLKYFCGDGAQRTEAQSRQRRRTDRGGGRQSGGGGGGGGKGKGDTKKKPPMTKEAQKKATTPKHKVVRVKSTAEYDSDSELSVNTDVAGTPARGRPSRKAALSASKLMASSVKDWGAAIPVPSRKDVEKDDDDESSFSSASDDDDSIVSPSDDGSSIEEIMLSDMAKAKGTSATKKGKASSGKKRAASEISSTDNDALNRAREKQRLALANAKASKKNGKPAGKKSKGKKMTQGKKKGKDKKFDSSSDDSSSDDAVDPMADIDMDKLVKEAMAGSRFSVLHSFCWWRIVLDEAHFIKSRTSQTAHSAFALTGIHRWCLSGTPLQNRVGELYSLIRFLRLDPMAHYLCRLKGCDCKSIHYRMASGKCLNCNHSSISHYSHFNKHILNPIQRDGYTGDGRRAMFTLKNEVLDKCLLRRTKESCAEDMNLPPRIVTIRTIRLHPIEEDFYNALYTQTRSSFDDYVAEGTLLNNYAHIFVSRTTVRWKLQSAKTTFCLLTPLYIFRLRIY